MLLKECVSINAVRLLIFWGESHSSVRKYMGCLAESPKVSPHSKQNPHYKQKEGSGLLCHPMTSQEQYPQCDS